MKRKNIIIEENEIIIEIHIRKEENRGKIIFEEITNKEEVIVCHLFWSYLTGSNLITDIYIVFNKMWHPENISLGFSSLSSTISDDEKLSM